MNLDKPIKWAKTIVGYANGNGGVMFAGVSNQSEVFGISLDEIDKTKNLIAIDGYSGFLFYDENDMPLVAMHWQHRFNHMVGRYNDIYRVQMPNITPHVCRHT